MINPLEIGIKIDSPEKIAATENLPANEKMMSSEINAIPAKINEIITVVNGLVAGEIITYSFESPRNVYRDYFSTGTQVQSIQTIGVASLALSTNNGVTFTPIALPLAAPLNLPLGWNIFRITYQPGIVGAAVNLTI